MAKTTAVRARQKGVTGYINVGRPTRWGNPFRVEEHGREKACRLYRECILNVHWHFDRDGFREALKTLKGRALGCPGCTQEQIDAGLCHAVVLAKFVDEKYPDEEVSPNA